jgi:RNA polymerase sigma-70 factor (ECF subfamily)
MPAVTASPEDGSAALERLIDSEALRLYRIALAIVDDRGDAEDVVQETMLSAWRHWCSLRNHPNQKAWLTRVCVNHSIHRRRALGRRVLWSSEQWLAASSGPVNTDGRLLDLHRAYQSLSARQRAMVALHLQDGFTVEECARFLGCRSGTARSHLGRAVAKLRKEFIHA